MDYKTTSTLYHVTQIFDLDVIPIQEDPTTILRRLWREEKKNHRHKSEMR